jgi:hypothetical protein
MGFPRGPEGAHKNYLRVGKANYQSVLQGNKVALENCFMTEVFSGTTKLPWKIVL